jgi:serine/threonine protein kinase/tetratricopeptide (TPR) repeat protein
MNADFQRVKDIFLAALERESGAPRSAYLNEMCGQDMELRQRVEALLARHEAAGSFLESPAPAVDPYPTVGEPASERPGMVVGPYKLLQQIGEGGMGTVYMAEQSHPVQRKVAVKIIRPGMDSRQIIARFEAERQALALMDHPNIAKVLDAGTVDAHGLQSVGLGRPYFVMELVKGVPITKYCDQHRLTPKERLELFIPVCKAVQHAHQKGIIHRDLKPSNVMIALYDGKPVPKVIDFGVAKATGQKLTDETLFTAFGQVVGTLEYMSPEQAELNQLDIDTRSDVYSLGVLLYELLTGTTPLQRKRLQDGVLSEVLRIIREEEPPKPSTRLSTTQELPSIAANRGLEPNKLSGLVRGELDWIVMKCLEKDRNRRYETANGLARDIERYLHDEPVQACPPSAGYKLRKLARKYRTLLRIVGVFVVFLVLAAAVSTWQAVRASLAERQALWERDRVEASFRMARDAVDQLFTQVGQSPKLKAHALEKFRKELLQNAKEFYKRFIREQFDAPAVRYDLGLAYLRLAEIDRELGDYAAAEESLTKAVALLGELAGAHPKVAEYQRDLAASYATLGLVRFDTARWEEAEAAFEQALAVQEKQAKDYPKAPEYRYALAKTYRASGFMHARQARPDSAGERYQQGLDVLSKLVQDYPNVTEYQSLLATTQTNLGTMYATKGWFDKAETPLQDAQRIYTRLVHGQPDALPEHLESLGQCLAILGMVDRGQAQTHKAEASQNALALSAKLVKEADAAQQQAAEIFEKLAKDHPDVLDYAYDVGRCYAELGLTAQAAGRPDAAVARYDKAIAVLAGVLGRGLGAARNSLLSAQIDRATALATRGDHTQATAEAEALTRQGELNSGHLYDLACTFSQASAAADRDQKLLPAERARLNARYADRAIDFLRQAIAKGWLRPQVLKTDPDFQSLRAREDFRKLLAHLEAASGNK